MAEHSLRIYLPGTMIDLSMGISLEARVFGLCPTEMSYPLSYSPYPCQSSFYSLLVLVLLWKPSLRCSQSFNYKCIHLVIFVKHNHVFCLSGVCCPTPDMENIIVISDRRDITGICVYAYGDYVSFTCDKGYYPLSTDGRSSCQADGTWKPKMPTCEPGENSQSIGHYYVPDFPHGII